MLSSCQLHSYKNIFDFTLSKVIRIERYTNNTRTVKPVFAVLQMINLYQRKLRRAQANHRRIAPWSKAVLPSHDLELVDGTLFIKGKRRLVGLLERLESYSGKCFSLHICEKSCKVDKIALLGLFCMNHSFKLQILLIEALSSTLFCCRHNLFSDNSIGGDDTEH